MNNFYFDITIFTYVFRKVNIDSMIIILLINENTQ